MSRRRTSEYYSPITISLLPSLIRDMEGEIKAKESRSQWIARAIEMRLEDSALRVRDANDVQLKLALHERVCGCVKTADCPTMGLLRRLKRKESS